MPIQKLSINWRKTLCYKLTVENALELWYNNENGLHCLNASDCVMFVKNALHPCVEKLFESVVSKGCGNGVGMEIVVVGASGTG